MSHKTSQLEQDLSCAAFAEAGQPCPVQADVPHANTHKHEPPHNKHKGRTIADEFACTAFLEKGENCPF